MFCIFAPSFRSIFTTQCNTCVIRCCVIRNTLEKCSVLRYNKSRKQGKGNRGKNMAETKELKPKSFRIDEETAEKFKAISAELGNNQQQTLSKLIETYEFQKGKTVLNQKRGEIETFEKYVTILTRMYMDSLEHNENITESVHAEFEGILGSKDETILSLQKQLKTAEEQVAAKKAEATESLKKAKDSDTENARLLAKIEENQASFEQALEDKEKLILALTQACDGYKKDVEEMEKVTLERSAMAAKHMQLQKDLTRLENENAALKNELDLLKLTNERELLQKEMAHAKEIQQLEQQRKEEIDVYQQKYLELLNQMQQKTKSVRIVKQSKGEKEETHNE